MEAVVVPTVVTTDVVVLVAPAEVDPVAGDDIMVEVVPEPVLVAALVLAAALTLLAALVTAVLVPIVVEVVALVSLRAEPAELVAVVASAGDAAALVVVVAPAAGLLGRMIRSSMTSTSVGAPPVVALVVPAVVLDVRTVPLGVGWGRTLMKTTTLPVGLMFMKVPSSAREAPGSVVGAALAVRRMVVAPLVVALVVLVVAVAPAVGLVATPAAMTMPAAEEKVPIHWFSPSTVLKKAAASSGVQVVEKSRPAGTPSGDTKVLVAPVEEVPAIDVPVIDVPVIDVPVIDVPDVVVPVATPAAWPVAAALAVTPADEAENAIVPVASSRPRGGAGITPLRTSRALTGAPVATRRRRRGRARTGCWRRPRPR